MMINIVLFIWYRKGWSYTSNEDVETHLWGMRDETTNLSSLPNCGNSTQVYNLFENLTNYIAITSWFKVINMEFKGRLIRRDMKDHQKHGCIGAENVRNVSYASDRL